MKEEITNLLEEILPPSSLIIVNERAGHFGGRYMQIGWAASDHLINRVSGQYPQLVSFTLDLSDMSLQPAYYGGNGGRTIYREVDKNNPAEKFYAMIGVKIDFRKPRPNKEAILKAISKAAQSWLAILRDNRNVLRYQDIVDYDKLLTFN